MIYSCFIESALTLSVVCWNGLRGKKKKKKKKSTWGIIKIKDKNGGGEGPLYYRDNEIKKKKQPPN